MKVFFSYASEDRDIAHAIADALRQEGHDVYPSARWPKDVGAALNRAEAFVILLSASAASSPYVNQELRRALVSPRFADRVIPVALQASVPMPWILRTMSPIAAKPTPAATAKAIDRRLTPRPATDAAAG